jgi:hypothetical protein
MHTHTFYFNNNTVINSASDGVALEAFSTSTLNAYLSNNIIYGSANYGIYKQNPSTGTINLANQYNLLFDNTTGNFSGATAGTGSLLVDPMFTNAGSDYHLQPASPAVDSGINTPAGGLGSLGEDLDGFTRMQDNDGDGTATVNMGAYEEPVSAPPSSIPASGGGGGGCFINTAAYVSTP